MRLPEGGQTLEHVGRVLELVGIIAFPTALGYAILGSVRAARWLAERRRRRAATVEPIERLGADLRRLHAQLDVTESGPAAPGRRVHLQAVRAAYVDALTTACQRLDVTPPIDAQADRLPWAEIYRVEAALRQRGLDVRETATP